MQTGRLAGLTPAAFVDIDPAMSALTVTMYPHDDGGHGTPGAAELHFFVLLCHVYLPLHIVQPATYEKMKTGEKTPNDIFTYDAIADAYASRVDEKPWNAEYDRPAVVSLLPPLAGLTVLDAGCGSGWYAEYCVGQGAAVTAFDITPRMVELTRARLGDRATVVQADLHRPLDFAADETFDLVVAPLVLHYVEHWEPVLAEFRRVLKPHGLLVFSTHHPFADYRLFGTGSYFATERVQDTWDVGTVRFYRRPLTAITEALSATGFVIERLVEPLPTEAFRRTEPKGYERLMKEPGFLTIRARREEGRTGV